MDKRIFHMAILIGCAVVVTGVWLVDVDTAGARVFGARWHVRELNGGFRQVRGAYEALKSFNAVFRGQWRRAFEIYWAGPVLLAFLVLQIPYHLYAVLIAPRGVDAGLMKLNCRAAALVLALIYVQMLIPLGGQLI